VRSIPKSTLEQWAVLISVIQEGGFAAAAKRLNRSQSSVSYAIGRLRDAVGVELLELQGRRAVITEAGAALMAEVVPLIEELKRIESRGQGIAKGGPIRIRLVVDTLFSKTQLFSALNMIVKKYPYAEINLTETVRKLKYDDIEYDLAVLLAPPGKKDINLVADMKLIAVARTGHPIFACKKPLQKSVLARYALVEIHESDIVEGTQSGAGRQWKVNSVESAIEVVRQGLCYGWLPLHLIQKDLTDDILRPIPLRSGSIIHIPLGLHVNDRCIDDPIVRELAKLIEAKDDA